MIKYSEMTIRFGSLAILLMMFSALLALGSCSQTPTTLSVSVSFLNPPTAQRNFPPSTFLHSGVFSDEVAYVRLLDDLGTVIWTSQPLTASLVGGYTTNPTDEDGAYIDTVHFTLTDTEVNGAAMPLHLEAYLYDAAPMTDPATDAGIYSYYDATYTGDPGWHLAFTITPGTIRSLSLDITVPISL